MRNPDSPLFRTIVRFSFFVINVLAIYLLLRGHNLPGGGFVGGLASAISLVLLNLALGVEEMHRVVRVDPVRVAAFGVAVAVVTGMGPMFAGAVFLQHYNTYLAVPVIGGVHVGTPLLFDIGVYFVVVGVTVKLVFVLEKSTQGLRALVEEEQMRYSAARESPVELQPGRDDELEEPATARARKEAKDAN